MKKLVCAVGLALVLSAFSAHGVATINWGTGPSGDLLQSDNSTPIVGNHTDSSLGGFLQLIFVGANGLDAVSYTEWDTPTGLLSSGNDQIVGTSWVGEGILGFLSPNGDFLASDVHSMPIGSQFVIRFFETASPNFGSGLVPTSGNYGISSTFVSTGNPDAGGTDDFNINSGLFTNLGPIPEPGTVALFGIGAVVLALRKRLKK